SLEAPPPGKVPSGWENKIMHATFRIGDSTVMASDGCHEGAKFEGFSLSLNPPSEADAKQIFDALSEGGQVGMPLMKTFWSPCFGMVPDKFGAPGQSPAPGLHPGDEERRRYNSCLEQVQP